MTLWNYPKPQFIELMELPFYVKPIKLLSEVSSLIISKDLPSNITEGVKFQNNSPIVQVLDINNSPISGKMVFVSICNFDGTNYPNRYTNVRKGIKAKKILNPIPGIYNSDSDNPLSFMDPVIPIFTNSTGYAIFKDSYFSKYGPIGKYKVEFICDGINVVSSFIEVTIIF